MQRGVWKLLLGKGLVEGSESRQCVGLHARKKTARAYAVLRCQALLRGEVAALDAELAGAEGTAVAESGDADEAAVADSHLQDAPGLDFADTQQLADAGMQD